MTLAVKTICLHNSLSFSSCFAMVKRIWRQGNIFWYFERGRFKEATDTTKIGKLFIISLIFQSVTLGICLEKKHLTTKLTRMNLYMFIYGNYSFLIYYSVPLVREKCNAINFRGWSLADLSCLRYPFSPKICRNVHIKIIASSNFKQIPIYLEINTLGKLLPTSYIRTFVLCHAKRQGVGRICSLSISEQESRLICTSRISFVFWFFLFFCLQNCLQAKVIISRQMEQLWRYLTSHTVMQNCCKIVR